MRKFIILLSALILLICATAYGVIIPDSRKVDWVTYPPGVSGGINHRTMIFTNLNLTGVADISTILNAAIVACPSNQVVYIPAGNFVSSNKITLKSYVTVRGAGPAQTVLHFRHDATNSALYFFQAAGTGYNTPPHTNDIVSGNTKGSTSLVLSTTNGLSPGAIVLVDHLNPEFITNGVIEGFDYLSREDGARLMGQMIEILTLDDHTITFTPALAWDYTNSAQVTTYSGMYRGIGLEDFAMTNSMAAVGDFTGGRNIHWAQVADSWVRNVSSRKTVQFHLLFHHCFRCTVRDSDWSYSLSYASARGYGMDLAYRCTQNLVENNWSKQCVIGFTSEGAGPYNVWGYNYGWGTRSDYGLIRDLNSNHGGAPHMNLFEGNNVNAIGADNIHGGSACNTIFRNLSRGAQANPSANDTNYYQRAVSINRGNWYINVVGNYLGDAHIDDWNSTYNWWTYEATDVNSANARPYIWRLGFAGAGYGITGRDYEVTNNIIRHGNFDLFTTNTVWDAAIADHDLPNSLYLAAQPSWWTNWGVTPWPPFGPDLTPMTNALPAQLRFESRPPLAIRNFRIQGKQTFSGNAKVN